MSYICGLVSCSRQDPQIWNWSKSGWDIKHFWQKDRLDRAMSLEPIIFYLSTNKSLFWTVAGDSVGSAEQCGISFWACKSWPRDAVLQQHQHARATKRSRRVGWWWVTLESLDRIYELIWLKRLPDSDPTRPYMLFLSTWESHIKAASNSIYLSSSSAHE